MSTLQPFAAGGYRFITYQFQYCRRARLPHRARAPRRPVPLTEGFDAIEAYLGSIGRPPTALCACASCAPRRNSPTRGLSRSTSFPRRGLSSARIRRCRRL